MLKRLLLISGLNRNNTRVDLLDRRRSFERSAASASTSTVVSHELTLDKLELNSSSSASCSTAADDEQHCRNVAVTFSSKSS